jgi:hypothetical protein
MMKEESQMMDRRAVMAAETNCRAARHETLHQ